MPDMQKALECVKRKKEAEVVKEAEAVAVPSSIRRGRCISANQDLLISPRQLTSTIAPLGRCEQQRRELQGAMKDDLTILGSANLPLQALTAFVRTSF